MGGVAVGRLVWVALAGDIAGCSVLQLWVAVWAVKLLCWEGICLVGLVSGLFVGG